MDEESGGDLWRTLSVEEDILKTVLMMLDSCSLSSLEITCRAFRTFIKRNKTWQKKFIRIDFHVLKYGTRMQLLLNINRPNVPSDLHVKYKQICLSLESNLKSELCPCRLCTNKRIQYTRCDFAQIRRVRFHYQHYHYQQQVDEEEFEEEIQMQM